MRTRYVVYALVALVVLTHRVAVAQENDAAVRTAVTNSLVLLQSSGRTWVERSGCVSCHHQSLPAMSFALARSRGFTLNEEATRERIQVTMARWAPQRELLFQADNGPISGGVMSAGYALLGLAADEVPSNPTTDAMVHYIAAQQLGDARFRGPNQNRPPLEHSDVAATAIAIRTLQTYATPGRREEIARMVRRARDWLLSIVPRGTEERSFQLQGLGWAHADKGEIAKRVAVLVSEQRSDGGWAQLSTLASDAYATGQALVALRQTGGLSTTSAVYRNGITFLLKTQFDDGSWLVTSRGRGTQPYFESGFPHGTDQFISAAGTAWATSALLLSLDARTVSQNRQMPGRAGKVP